jgi:hypothetical protein
MPAELEHRIGYSRVMNRFEFTKARADSVALRDKVYGLQITAGESIRVAGG